MSANPLILEGVRVIELGVWVAGPAAGGILADWGADVIKVEPPKGDPQRNVFKALGLRGDRVAPFEADNRGKRSVVLDLQTEDGKANFLSLLATADIFITNIRPEALIRLGLDPDKICERFPRLIYGRLSGYGTEGPDSHRAGYDVGAFWSRAGVNTRLVHPDEAPPNIPPGFGDHMTALSLVSGVMAALYSRERTGRGQLVDTSLLRTGIYGLAADFSMQIYYDKLAPRSRREDVPAPLVNCYKTKDEKWIWLLGVESSRHWPNLLAALGRESLAKDPRFEDARLRYKNKTVLIAVLDLEFLSYNRDEICQLLDQHDVWWAPVQSVEDVLNDPQAIASGAFVEIPGSEQFAARKAVASPVSFNGVTPQPSSHSPEMGEHTDEILTEQKRHNHDG